MAVAKVALSLPTPLLTRIDRLAKKARVSRSALVREVMETAFRGSAEAALLQKAQRLYAEIEKEDRVLSAKFLPLAAETLPSSAERRRR